MSRSENLELRRIFPPRVARHKNNPKGVASLSPGLAESSRPTLGAQSSNPSISRAARRAQRVSQNSRNGFISPKAGRARRSARAVVSLQPGGTHKLTRPTSHLLSATCSKSFSINLPHNFPPRAARHKNNPEGVAELSPGLPESARATLGITSSIPSISRAARRAQRVSRDPQSTPVPDRTHYISREEIARKLSNEKGIIGLMITRCIHGLTKADKMPMRPE